MQKKKDLISRKALLKELKEMRRGAKNWWQFINNTQSFGEYMATERVIEIVKSMKGTK